MLYSVPCNVLHWTDCLQYHSMAEKLCSEMNKILGFIEQLILSQRTRISQRNDTHNFVVSLCIVIISRPTPRLLSFALCLEWINGIYRWLVIVLCVYDSVTLCVGTWSRDLRWRTDDVISECKQRRPQRLHTTVLRHHARPRPPTSDVTATSRRQPQPRRLQRTNVCLFVCSVIMHTVFSLSVKNILVATLIMTMTVGKLTDWKTAAMAGKWRTWKQ